MIPEQCQKFDYKFVKVHLMIFINNRYMVFDDFCCRPLRWEDCGKRRVDLHLTTLQNTSTPIVFRDRWQVVEECGTNEYTVVAKEPSDTLVSIQNIV